MPRDTHPNPNRRRYSTNLELDLIDWIRQEVAHRKASGWIVGGNRAARQTTEADVINEAIRRTKEESQR